LIALPRKAASGGALTPAKNAVDIKRIDLRESIKDLRS
jgi:hypothetical protein